jgi:Tol biopolymer transport system component
MQVVFLMMILLSAYPLLAISNIKLSGTMPAFGDVTRFQISLNGRYAVYLADQNTDEVDELYSVLLDGGTPIRLNSPLPTGMEVFRFEISPDSRRVVYQAQQGIQGVSEFYSVPIGGPAASGIKLNPILMAGGGIGTFQISPDSNRVVYRASQDTPYVQELYSVPILGPAASGIKLNGPLVADGYVFDFQISPDSNRVVYQADQDTHDAFEFYSVPIGGPAASGIKLSRSLVADGAWHYFHISPDSSRVVYLAEQDTPYVNELYSVLIGGPAASGIKLNGPLPAGGDVYYNFLISPDSSRVVYLAEQDTDNVPELYSVPIVGPAASGIKLNPALVAGGVVSTFQISPDSNRVVYQADQETNDVYELYSVPIGGPAASGIKLNPALVASWDIVGFQFSPDSRRVVYRAGWQSCSEYSCTLFYELYSVPIVGPAASGIKLNTALVEDIFGEYDSSYKISPDSRRVVYHTDQDTNNVYELYSVPIGGPAASGIKINGPLVAGGNVGMFFQISPDSRRVVYRADQDIDNVYELYMTSIYLLHLPLILK